MALLLAAIGAVAGVIAGLLGVGGGIVLVPAFFYAFQHLGYDTPQLMQLCLATSLATIVFTSARSLHSHHRKGAVDWAVLRGWAPAIACGAVLGVIAASSLRSATLTAAFGVLALVAGLYMSFGRPDWRLGSTLPGGAGRAGMGTGLGFFSVLMGIGGGTFGVPMMTLFGMPIHRAVATASGLGLVIALPSVLGFLFLTVDRAPPWTLGAVNLPAFLVVIGTTLMTTPWGVRLAHAMDARPLKRAFGAFVLVVGLNMLRKALGW
jgi:uncharacterized membrane protein YfcA